jgi:hypothetical protein
MKKGGNRNTGMKKGGNGRDAAKKGSNRDAEKKKESNRDTEKKKAGNRDAEKKKDKRAFRKDVEAKRTLLPTKVIYKSLVDLINLLFLIWDFALFGLLLETATIRATHSQC